mmetsp:Transcript_1737/g.6112  ORF Transcript_1737/g.6112 Transcript_1737/m.6112 type:complete len:218 (-) Transcript_1737:181-834(-)
MKARAPPSLPRLLACCSSLRESQSPAAVRFRMPSGSRLLRRAERSSQWPQSRQEPQHSRSRSCCRHRPSCRCCWPVAARWREPHGASGRTVRAYSGCALPQQGCAWPRSGPPRADPGSPQFAAASELSATAAPAAPGHCDGPGWNRRTACGRLCLGLAPRRRPRCAPCSAHPPRSSPRGPPRNVTMTTRPRGWRTWSGGQPPPCHARCRTSHLRPAR